MNEQFGFRGRDSSNKRCPRVNKFQLFISLTTLCRFDTLHLVVSMAVEAGRCWWGGDDGGGG